jgi:hypothetical protein
MVVAPADVAGSTPHTACWVNAASPQKRARVTSARPASSLWEEFRFIKPK